MLPLQDTAGIASNCINISEFLLITKIKCLYSLDPHDLNMPPNVNIYACRDGYYETENKQDSTEMNDVSRRLSLIFLPTNMLLRFVKHKGFVKLPGIVPPALLVSLIRSYGNKNKSTITREEQVDDGWRCFPSPRSDAVAVVVTVATGLTTFLCSKVLSRLGKINMFYPQFSINWAN